MNRSLPCLTLLCSLLAPLAALAERAPLQSDVERCTLAAQSRGALVQGRPQLTLLLRKSGQVYAAFARAAGGLEDLPLLRCFSQVATRWELPAAPLDSRRPFDLTLVPGGTVLSSRQSRQGRAAVFLPDLRTTAEERALEAVAAQQSLVMGPDATAAERGEALRMVGRAAEAAQVLREALEENPADPLALRSLATLLAAPGALQEPEAARGLAERLAALDPDSAAASEATLAACLAQRDDACTVAAWRAAKESPDLAPRARALLEHAEAAREAAARFQVAEAAKPQPCAPDATEEERALCVVRLCLDEGAQSWASALSAQNGEVYRLADWRSKAAGPGRVWVIRPIASDTGGQSPQRSQHDAVWLVKVGGEVTVTAVSPEARQITRAHSRCGGGRLALAR